MKLDDMLTFDAEPLASFTLTLRDPGSYESTSCFALPVAGQTCTPADSYLRLINLQATASLLTFSVNGIRAY
jgi:hypothetical protein